MTAGVTTYAELDARAAAFAGVLRRRGVAPGDRVAFHLDRGAEVFVVMLGILRAGAAYAAVDTQYPDARRDMMIRRSEPALLVTEPGWGGRFTGLGIDVLELTEPGPPGAAAEHPLPPVSPAQPACVMFTSGSSGQPKAIVLEHRNLVHFAVNPTLPALTADDRVGHVSSLSFDAFHFETWCTLAAGAQVVVLPRMPDLIGGDVQNVLRRRRVTAMLVPTMAVNHVVREDRDAFASLRILHTGGDVVQPATCRELLGGAFAGSFTNLYGPTEVSTACTAHRITDVAADAGTVPIGRPLAGGTIHLLGPGLDEVADGEVGELYAGGPGVAWGYLGQPALTAGRFLPDPWAGDGRRMYATGDLARRRPDGALEFLGRADDQVKIRGYRVEPREVEQVLCRHPEVRDAAVVVVGEDDNRHLVALVVPYDGLAPKQLRAYATEVLPDYMVPSSVLRVPQIPANGHGKRDLDELRRLAREHLRRAEDWVRPRDDIELYIADLWEELLAVERVGATDDFFALGGNSLLAFRLLRRIVKELDVRLEPFDVLSTSELSALAALIRSRKELLTI
ncbi:amino acid adenylation domain-containing protein [Paractinoplanes brasiliensis]|uniref:Amino acid adenylation domain-containing protein n=1 Tax=Paractinoplanes brasiliensis TaxID=52695 RepID=A0A4V6PSY9_9ACTN|nr:amino acid adenylation domain-containing protein [Actinoplanes brasiliensis]